MKSRRSHINYLYDKTLNKDSKAINELFDYLCVSFRLFLQSRNLDRHDIEEIIQSVMLTISSKFDSLTSAQNFSGWAYGVLRNKLFDYYKTEYRKQKRYVGEDSVGEKVPISASDPLLLMQLKKCLTRLSKKNPRYMRILNLFYLGLTKDEICDKLKITSNYFYVILLRARTMLKECLEEGDTIK